MLAPLRLTSLRPGRIFLPGFGVSAHIHYNMTGLAAGAKALRAEVPRLEKTATEIQLYELELSNSGQGHWLLALQDGYTLTIGTLITDSSREAIKITRKD